MVEQAVTELVIDARGAEVGSAAYVRAMQNAQSAFDRFLEKDAAMRSAQSQSATVMMSSATSIGTLSRQWERLKASLDPAYDSTRKVEQAMLLADRAATVLGKSEAEVGRVLDAVRLKHDEVAAAASRQAAEYTRLASAGRQAYAADQAQSSFNSKLGVRDPVSGAARASANAMDAEFTRMERVAQQRAEQIGSNFANGLNDRLVPGVRKSARDAAQALSEIYDEQDRIARLRAEQTGSYFTADLNERMGIGRTARSAQESAGVFATSGGSRLSGNQLQGLSYQANDVITMALMGANPSQIVASQGGQIFQNLQQGEGGVRGSLDAIKGSATAAATAIASMLGPVGLVGAGVAGLTVAAGAFFYSLEDRAQNVNDLLEKHAGLISRIRDLWPSAAAAAQTYQVGSSDVLRADIQKAQEEFAATQMEQQRNTLRGTETFKLSWFGPEELDPIRKVVNDLRRDTDAGTPALLAYQAALARIEADPASSRSLIEMANALRQVAEEGANAERELNKLWAAQHASDLAVAGHLRSEREPLSTSVQDDRNRRWSRDNALIDAQAEVERARTDAERIAAARNLARAQNPVAGRERDHEETMAGMREELRIAAEIKQAQEERTRSLDASLLSKQRELTLIGQTTAAQAAGNFQFQAYAEIEAEMARTGRSRESYAAQIAAIDATAAAMGRLAAQAEALNGIQSQREQLTLGQTEYDSIGKLSTERERAITLARTELDIVKSGIDAHGELAQQWRDGAAALANQNEQKARAQFLDDARFDRAQMDRSPRDQGVYSQLRGTPYENDPAMIGYLQQVESAQSNREIAKGFFSDFRQQAVQNGGNIGSAFSQAALNAANKLLDRQMDQLFTSAANWLFPAPDLPKSAIDNIGGKGTIANPMAVTVVGGAGSILGSLTGGVAGDDGLQLPEVVVPGSGVAASSVNARSMSGSVAQQAWSFFKGKGLSDHATAALLGQIHAESAFNPAADTGDGGKALGLFQWNDRGPAMTAAVGQNWRNNVQGQLEYAWKELNSSESASLAGLRSATDIRSATRAAIGFERPSGWSANNPEGGHNFSGRLGAAETAMSRFGGKVTEATHAVDQMKTGATAAADAAGGAAKGMGTLAQQLMNVGGSQGGDGWFSGLMNKFGGAQGATNWMMGISPLATNFLAGGGVGLFDRGGFTGDGPADEVAGLAHKGEFYFSAPATRNLGIGYLDALHNAAKSGRGLRDGGYAGGPIMPRMQAPANQGGSRFSLQIVNAGQPVEVESQREEVDPEGNRRMIVEMRNIARDELTTPGRKGTKMQQTLYGGSRRVKEN